MKIRYLSGLDISGSGLHAQRRQMDVSAENLANVHTTRTESGDPYRRQVVTFEAVADAEAGGGARIPDYEQAPVVTTHSAHRDIQAVFGSRPGAGGDPPQVGAEVVADESEFLLVHDPAHPDADAEGNVRMPNVDSAQELVLLMVAARAYEANVAALGAAKTMADAALDLAR